MRAFLEGRRTKKWARDVLRHVRHARNVRGDLWTEPDHAELAAREKELHAALRSGVRADILAAGKNLASCADRLAPPRANAGLRENLEVVVVALAVAMAFRSYFVQPFKIPTGSMQPTLYGIHSQARAQRSVSDRLPLNILKWMVFGERYVERRVKVDGILGYPQGSTTDPSVAVYYIDGVAHVLPKDAEPLQPVGSLVHAGDLLWSGIVTHGDHVFVDKVRWHFLTPRRGEVMVFGTDGIPSLPPGTHYIKRMSGLPGETVSIHPPWLFIDGERVLDPDSIRRIAEQDPGYDGYWVDADAFDARMRTPADTIHLGPGQYLALGDNTHNSRDGRYWGPVPERKLVGPAFFVYWPISRRWGLVR